MAKGIVLKSKSVTTSEGVEFYSFGFVVADTTSLVEVPAVFKQTQALTSAYCGISDKGVLVTNSEDYISTSGIKITAVTLEASPSTIEVTTTLAALLALDLDDAVTSS